MPVNAQRGTHPGPSWPTARPLRPPSGAPGRARPIGFEVSEAPSKEEEHAWCPPLSPWGSRPLPSRGSSASTSRSTGTTAAGSRRTGRGRRWWGWGCPTSDPCRTTSPSTTRWASPAASTPSRGTSSSPSPRGASSARGWTCARAPPSAPCTRPSSTRAPRCSSPRAWATRTRPWSPPPRTPTWSTPTGPPTRATRSSTSPTRRWRCPGRSRWSGRSCPTRTAPTRAWPMSPHSPPPPAPGCW